MIQPCVIRIGVQRVILILMSATHGMRVAPLVTRNRVVKSAANLVKPRPYLRHRGFNSGRRRWCRCFVARCSLLFPSFPILLCTLHEIYTCMYLLKKKRKKEIHSSPFKFAISKMRNCKNRSFRSMDKLWKIGRGVGFWKGFRFVFEWKKSREAACILSKYIQWKNHLVKLDNRSIRWYNDNNRSDNNNNRSHHYYLA